VTSRIGQIVDRIRSLMDELDLTGEYDVECLGSVRAVGWIGKPDGNDVQVRVTVSPLEQVSFVTGQDVERATGSDTLPLCGQ